MGKSRSVSSVRDVEAYTKKGWVLSGISLEKIINPDLLRKDEDPRISFLISLEKAQKVDGLDKVVTHDFFVIMTLSEIMEHAGLVWELLEFMIQNYNQGAQDRRTAALIRQQAGVTLKSLLSQVDQAADVLDGLLEMAEGQ